MSDLRSRLERIGDRVRVAPDAFERLERARRRRERNRRITAGALALLVAIAGTVAAYTAFRTNDGGPPVAATPSGAPAGPGDVAEFTCDESGTISPNSLTVDTQPDGVHVAVTNAADEPVSFAVASVDPPSHVVGGDGADAGERKETVWQLPPGDATVSCTLASAGGIDTSPIASLRVQDPTGSYVPIGMNCPMSGEIPEYVEGATGSRGDPVEVARQHLSGLEYDDAVERAGYPESELPVVRVLRRGDVVATATLRNDGRGGWLMDTLNVCVNVLIGWSDEVTGVSGPMGPTGSQDAWYARCSSARADGVGTDHNGARLVLEGRDIAFDTECLIAPSGEPFTIRLANGDDGVQRNVSIYELTPYLRECIVTGTSPLQDVDQPLFEGELVGGIGEITYDVGPLEPGEYYFQDDMHPGAHGVLVVE